MIWIGIDPGKDTGIAVRDRDQLVWHCVIEGGPITQGEILPQSTLDDVGDAVNAAFDAACRQRPAQVVEFAIEGVTRPNAHHKGKKAFIDPFAVAVPALVSGAIRGRRPVTVVLPGGHGSNWLCTYPPELVTAAEQRHGLDRPGGNSATIRHARSAWDIAGAARYAARIQASGGAA